MLDFLNIKWEDNMNTAAELGLRVNWVNVIIIVGILVVLFGIVEKIIIDAKPKEITFWIINVILTGCIFGLIMLTCKEKYESKYTYDGVYSDVEISNIKTSQGGSTFKLIQFSNPDGSIEEVPENETQILCVTGRSRSISYAESMTCELYSNVRLVKILALNYSDYIKVLGDTDVILQYKPTISMIKDCNLMVVGLDTMENGEPKEKDGESLVEVDSSIKELTNMITQKDNIIQDYSDKNIQLEETIKQKEEDIKEKDVKIEKLTKDNEKQKAKLKETKQINFTSKDFINICIGIGILVLVGMGVFLMIMYTKHRIAKLEMTLKSELKIREGVMLDKDL